MKLFVVICICVAGAAAKPVYDCTVGCQPRPQQPCQQPPPVVSNCGYTPCPQPVSNCGGYAPPTPCQTGGCGGYAASSGGQYTGYMGGQFGQQGGFGWGGGSAQPQINPGLGQLGMGMGQPGGQTGHVWPMQF